jgi:preprotein translocase subunit YajC
VVTVSPAPQLPKVAEIDVYFIRLPFVSDEQINDGIKKICQFAFDIFAPELVAGDVRLECQWDAFWKATVDVYSRGTPIPWAFIAGFIVGAVVSGIIIYFVVIRPLKEAMVSVAKDISQVISEKEKAVEEGKLDKETAAKLNSMLSQAYQRAKEAGEEEPWEAWVKYLQPVFELLPLVLIVAIIAYVLVALPPPQRRRE